MILTILLWSVIGAANGSFQRSVPPDTLITLRRSNCFFTCPDYLVTITADGKVVFEGYANVKVKGRAETTISIEKVRALIEAFEKAKFFTLRDSYSRPEDGCRIHDGDTSSAIVSIVMNGKKKSINHYLGCFEKKGSSVRRLLELEGLIDDLTTTVQWIE